MRVAILSDEHGNSITLDAVLADVAARGGADRFLVLGDLVAIGHDPIGVLERLTALPDVRFVQGNTDRFVVTGQRPVPDSCRCRGRTRQLPMPRPYSTWVAGWRGVLIAAVL